MLIRDIEQNDDMQCNDLQTPDDLKTRTGEEAFNPSGLSQRSISKLKESFPDLEVYTDVALDPYNSDGHDGIVRDDGVIMNDQTIEYLCRQAVSQVRASYSMQHCNTACYKRGCMAENYGAVNVCLS